jgi:hypothetical protein
MGKPGIGGDEKGNLYQQTQAGTQGIEGMIVVLTKISGQQKILLVALEYRLDAPYLWRQTPLDIPLRLLPFLRHNVEGQAQQAYHHANADNGNAVLPKNLMKKNKDKFNYPHYRKNDDCIQKINHDSLLRFCRKRHDYTHSVTYSVICC